MPWLREITGLPPIWAQRLCWAGHAARTENWRGTGGASYATLPPSTRSPNKELVRHHQGRPGSPVPVSHIGGVQGLNSSIRGRSSRLSIYSCALPGDRGIYTDNELETLPPRNGETIPKRILPIPHQRLAQSTGSNPDTYGIDNRRRPNLTLTLTLT